MGCIASLTLKTRTVKGPIDCKALRSSTIPLLDLLASLAPMSFLATNRINRYQEWDIEVGIRISIAFVCPIFLAGGRENAGTSSNHSTSHHIAPQIYYCSFRPIMQNIHKSRKDRVLRHQL
jgi:hypothetical protein